MAEAADPRPSPQSQDPGGSGLLTLSPPTCFDSPGTSVFHMAEIAPSSGRVRDGEAALARGAWEEARAVFERALEVRETVEALDGLGWAAWWVEDVPTCLDARERAYRLCRREGEVRRAGMLAIWLANDHMVLRGERAIASGWFRRAARILEGAEPCAEHGWLDALLGYMAIGEGDQPKARALGVRARELGRRLGVVSLEMFALSVEGVALVTEGETQAGMGCLDEAAAAALAGEYEEIVPAGWTCCLLLNACERVRDYERAGEWCGKVKQFGDRMKINFVTGACKAHYGAVLTWQGRWAEAERELTEATEYLAAQRPTWSGLAIVRLADLRRRQGRFAEAQELLLRAEGNALTPVVLADMSLDLGDASAAGDLLEPVLRRVPERSRTLRLAPVEVMVRAKAAAGETGAAAAHLSELSSIAELVGTRPLHATARFCEGLVAAAGGDDETARAKLEDAVDLFAASGAAFELARARLALARVLAASGREDAAARQAVLALGVWTRSERLPKRTGHGSWSGSMGLGRRPRPPCHAVSSSPAGSSRSCGWSRRVSRTPRSRRAWCSAGTPSTATFRTRTPGWAAPRGPRRSRRRTGSSCCKATGYARMASTGHADNLARSGEDADLPRADTRLPHPSAAGSATMSIGHPNENGEYLLADQPSELERLQLQSRVWEPSGRQLLEEIGDGSGGACWTSAAEPWAGFGSWASGSAPGEVVGGDIDEACSMPPIASWPRRDLRNVSSSWMISSTASSKARTFDLVHGRT